eukprot:gb/GFBE01044764.1/.p1 GENE.gb/GFBE01044764.1/~~gb/GFBE01044764.1/.p1  ORF type:complete len:221 (+),score=85.82 gb/GFBE01044764.1/:1-663(+)
MFGFDCASTCNRQDATTSTVKVDMEAMSRCQQHAEEEMARRREEEQRQEQARKLAEQEEMERRRQAALEQKMREQREAEERARLEQERLERERRLEEERQEQRRVAAEAAARERAEADRLEREERERDVAAFLKQHGFAGVDTAKKSFLSSTYALHKAAELGDVKIVAMLMKSGADVSKKNSSGKTAAQVAAKKDKKGSHAAVLSVLSVSSSGYPASGGA